MGMRVVTSTLYALALTWSDGFYVQSSNSLGQSACTVAAFMMSTCNAGCEFVRFVLCFVGDTYFLISFQRSLFYHCSRGPGTLAQVVLTTPTCASVAPSDIHF